MSNEIYEFASQLAKETKEAEETTEKTITAQLPKDDSYILMNGADLIRKKLEDLDYILKSSYKELNDKILKQEQFGFALYEYIYSSIDNLLMLQTSLLQNMIDLEEKEFIDAKVIDALTKSHWYDKITINQKSKITNKAIKEAIEEYKPIKEKRLKIIAEITAGIKHRKEEGAHDREI